MQTLRSKPLSIMKHRTRRDQERITKRLQAIDRVLSELTAQESPVEYIWKTKTRSDPASMIRVKQSDDPFDKSAT
jgi:hypothetical protein